MRIWTVQRFLLVIGLHNQWINFMELCKICNKIFLSLWGLSNHIKKIHKIESKEYYDRFLKKENDGLCYCEKNTEYQGLQGYRQYCSYICMNNASEVQEKKKKTCLKNYGVGNPFQSEIVQMKYKQTCLKKYEVENPSQIFEIKEKKRQTVLLHTDHQNKEINEKRKQACIKHFGFDNWRKTQDGRKSSRINFIRMVENQKLNGEPLTPRVGDQERPFLNELQQYTDLKILRQDHRFTYQIGRFPDGFIEELNLIILYHERNHYIDNTFMIETEDTIQTTKDYESLNLKVFKVSEKEWNNKEYIINQFQTLIRELTDYRISQSMD